MEIAEIFSEVSFVIVDNLLLEAVLKYSGWEMLAATFMLLIAIGMASRSP